MRNFKKAAAAALAVLIVLLFAGCSDVRNALPNMSTEESSQSAPVESEGAKEEKLSVQETYAKAMQELKNGDYKSALESFSQIEDYSDAANWKQDCADIVSADEAMAGGDYSSAATLLYNLQNARTITAVNDKFFRCAAQKYMDEGAYQISLNYLYEIANGTYEHTDGTEIEETTAYNFCMEKGDDEVKAMAENCSLGLKYREAEKLYSAGKYSDAQKAFEALGDYKDSAEMAAKAYDSYSGLAVTYEQAEKYYNDGYYYKAYNSYISIKNYLDSAQKAEACRRTMPSTGDLKTYNGSQCSITIYAPSGDSSVYVKMYDSAGSLEATVFLSPGGSSTLYVNNGDHVINVAYGTSWWGSKDLFGDGGSYCQLTDQSGSSYFNLSNGDYSLQLQTSTNGNVGSKGVGRGNF